METKLEALQGTRTALLTFGWKQGSYGNTDGEDPTVGGMCIEGAMRYAMHGSPYASTADALFWSTLDFLQLFTEGHSVVGWNDISGRTAQEVIEMLDKAITRA